MKTIVINLAADSARWSAVSAEFDKLGLHPIRHEATPGDALTTEQRQRLYSDALNRQQYHRPLRPGEIGCYASHIAVWQRLLASDDACLAIFEDDIELMPDLPQVLRTIERAPRDSDLVKLIGRPVENVRATRPLLRDHALITYQRVPSLTGAYVLTRRGAEKLLARRAVFGRPVDVDLRYWWECDLRVHGVQPYPVRAAATSAESTIEGRYVEGGPAVRLHKLALQARYTWQNWQALRLRGADPEVDAAPPVRVGARRAGREPA